MHCFVPIAIPSTFIHSDTLIDVFSTRESSVSSLDELLPELFDKEENVECHADASLFTCTSITEIMTKAESA